jgi:putative ABC transport system ATP-binding protein
MIQFDQVSKVYRGRAGPVCALSEVSLYVAAGEFAVVEGPSGSGKSTLLSIAGGLCASSSGTVRVDGQDLVNLSPAGRARFRARHVGFVFQMFHLFPYLSVLENVAAGASDPREAFSRARELLERCRLSDRLRHRPGELSTGECQRVAVARALINRPRLILADEPTGNLDPASARAVMDLLAEFHSEGGTVMLVTHREMAGGPDHRTIVLKAGCIEHGEAARMTP